MTAVTLTDDEEAIGELAGDVFARRAPLATQEARARDGAGGDLDRALLGELGGLGFFSQAVPASAGGLGLSWLASGLVAEAAGRELVPGPWLEQLVAVRLLASGGVDVVDPYASGTRPVALAVGPGSARATWDAAAGTASGTLRGLRCGDQVDRFVVVAEGATLVVDPAAAGVGPAEPEPTVDPLWRSVEVHLDGVVPELVLETPRGAAEDALALASCLVAAASVGAAARALDIGVAYVRDRYQFGVPVGSFQAVKHRLANAYIELLHARALVRRALAVEGTATVWEARLAADRCERTVAEAALQVHGGIGFTSEVPIHLFLKGAQQRRAWPEPVDGAHDRVRAWLGLDDPLVEGAA